MNESLKTNEEIKNFSLSEHNKQNFIAKLNQLDLTKGYVASVKLRKTSRSDAQNRTLWQFFTEFAEYVGYEGKDEIESLKQMVTMKLHPKIIDDKITGEQMPLPPETSKMDTAEFTVMFDKCLRYAANLGFYFEVQK